MTPTNRCIIAVCAAALAPLPVIAGQAGRGPARPAPAAPQATAVWIGPAARPGATDTVHYRQGLRLTEAPESARLTFVARGELDLYVNGRIVLENVQAGARTTAHVARLLASGRNVVAFAVSGRGGDGALWFEMELRYRGGRAATVVSSGDERVALVPLPGWQDAAHDDSRWAAALMLPDGNRPPAPTTVVTPPPAQPAAPTVALDASRLVRLWNAPSRTVRAGDRMVIASRMATASEFPALASAGVTLLESEGDLAGLRETAAGRYDLAVPDADLDAARRAGFGWTFHPHFRLPETRRERTPLVRIECLEHNLPAPAVSPWNPDYRNQAASAYQGLAQAYRGREGFAGLRLGMPGQFGEAGLLAGGLPASARDEIARGDRDAHHHPDWWAGDSLARAAFRGAMLSRYRTLSDLNAAWGTRFRTTDEVAYPRSPTDGTRRRWLDFVGWYVESAADQAAAAAESARRVFGDSLLMLPVPTVPEGARGSHDASLLARAVARERAHLRLPLEPQAFPAAQAGEIGAAATAAKFFNAPLWVDLTGVGSPDQQTARMFAAASFGARGLTASPGEVGANRDLWYRFGKFLRVDEPLTDVAMLYPTTTGRLRGGTTVFERGSAEIRDVLNYDVVDENLVAEGALSRYRVAVLWEGVVWRGETLERLREWVRGGGVLVAYDFGKMESVEGDRSWHADLFGYASRLRPVTGPGTGSIDLNLLRNEWARPYGRGWTVFFPGRQTALRDYQEVVRNLTYRLSEIDPTKQDAPSIDASWDSVYTTLFRDRALFYNAGRETARFAVTLPGPGAVRQEVTVEPRSIAAAYLTAPPQELLFQCEGFRTLGVLRPLTGETFSPGRGTTHVLIPAGGEISTRFQVDTPGRYEVLYRAVRRGGLARAEVLVDGRALTSGPEPATNALVRQTFSVGSATLSAGIHTLTVRPRRGEDIRADFVVLTSDPAIAGYGFAVRPGAAR
jgi:hypothetical protein